MLKLFGYVVHLCVWLVILLLFVEHSGASSRPVFGRIVGIVRDSTGDLLPDCVITLEKAGTPYRKSTMADHSASYAFPNLEPGLYTVTMMAQGFEIAEYKKIRLLANQSVRIDGLMIAATDNKITEVVESTALPIF